MQRTDQNQRNSCMISIVMLSYNHEKYIRQALDGVLMQKTDYSYEIIIHDDASTDESARIIVEYAYRYPEKIKRIIQKENQYSKGIDIITDILLPMVCGKYIAYCECDDYWLNDYKLQKQISFLESNPEYSAVSHNCIFVNADGNETDPKKLYGPFKQHIHTLNDGLFSGQSSTIVCRSEILKEMPNERRIAYQRIRANGDMVANLLLLLSGNIYHLDKTMSAYRVVRNSGNSWTARTHNKNLEAQKFIAEIDMRNFALSHYGINIRNNYQIFKSGFRSISKYIKDPNDENREVLLKIRKEVHGSIHLVIFLLNNWAVSIPFRAFRKLQQIKRSCEMYLSGNRTKDKAKR